MEAQTLNCSSCGAVVSTEAPVCLHCGARLATLACPSCFGMMTKASKFCPHCGAVAAVWQSTPTSLPCPECGEPLVRGELGPWVLYECIKCFGLWVDRNTFENVCRQAQQQSITCGPARAAELMTKKGKALPKVRYVRCPQCQQHMNRVNFAECSGVVVDVCRDHGTWFEAHELQRIVHFIRDGGMEKARERQKSELEAQRRQFRLERATSRTEVGTFSESSPALFPDVIVSVGGLLEHWFKH
jgi:Zn-finger nucleic acid-binding protein